MKLGRLVRIGIGISLLALAGSIVAPRLLGHVSIDAVVNGRVSVLRTPIEGTVIKAPPPVGARITAGAMVAEVRNPRINRQSLGEFLAERATLKERIDALDRQGIELAAMRDRLDARASAYREAVVVSLEKERKEIEARRRGTLARIDERNSDLKRQATLAGQGYQTQARHEQALSNRDQAVAEAAELAASIERVDERMSWTRRGVIGSDGQNDVPYSQQRVDEIVLREQDNAARRQEYIIRLGQLDRLITVEQDRIERMVEARLLASRDGIVWRNHVPTGGDVQQGAWVAELLDCGDLFLDVTVDERKFEDIRPGVRADILLIGSTHTIPGTVRSVRGSGAVTEDPLLAAKVPSRAPKEFQVIVDLDRNALDLGEGTFCQVGRAAKVTIRKGQAENGWGGSTALDRWIDRAVSLLRDIVG